MSVFEENIDFRFVRFFSGGMKWAYFTLWICREIRLTLSNLCFLEQKQKEYSYKHKLKLI